MFFYILNKKIACAVKSFIQGGSLARHIQNGYFELREESLKFTAMSFNFSNRSLKFESHYNSIQFQ